MAPVVKKRLVRTEHHRSYSRAYAQYGGGWGGGWGSSSGWSGWPSSRLVILFGWLRFVCANGLVIGETKIEI
jgi:hypothetical protein